MADQLVIEADQLHEQKKIQEVFDLLQKGHKDHPEDVEIAWRLARAYFDIAESKPNDAEWKKSHLNSGLEVAQKALTLNDKHFAPHKWVAIMTSAVGDFVATKEKIGNAYKIKEHALKALEYKPDDATTNHLLGRWCVGVASIGWLDRKLASALFATPPESSYEEALTYFLKAQELDPSFLRNLIFLGDTYVQLKQNDKAKESYKKATELPVTLESEKVYQEEAKKKLAKL